MVQLNELRDLGLCSSRGTVDAALWGEGGVRSPSPGFQVFFRSVSWLAQKISAVQYQRGFEHFDVQTCFSRFCNTRQVLDFFWKTWLHTSKHGDNGNRPACRSPQALCGSPLMCMTLEPAWPVLFELFRHAVMGCNGRLFFFLPRPQALSISWLWEYATHLRHPEAIFAS